MSTKIIRTGESVGAVTRFGSKRGARVVRMKRLLKERARASKRKRIESIVADLKHAGTTESVEDKRTIIEELKEDRKKRKRKRRLMTQRSEKKRKISHKSSVGSSYSVATPTEEDPGPEHDMQEWVELGVPHPLRRALCDLKFYQPTEIQRRAIPLVAKDNNDIIGAAETGSGKTLAFGIPILQYILNNFSNASEHAQNHTAAKPKKTTNSKKSNDDKPLKGRRKKESEREENVIDLNEVLHRIEWSQLETADSESKGSEIHGTSKEDALDKDGADQPLFDEMEIDEQESLASDSELEDDSSEPDVSQDLSAEGSSVRSKRRVAKVDTGLIGFKDDIPDEEFQKMMAGELDPWESDDDTTANDMEGQSSEASKSECQSHDIKTKSHDSAQHQEGKRSCGGGSGDDGLIALILAPTRELAIQVHDHLTAVAKYTDIKVCAVVGGMAMEKQERLLSRHPSIVVATPGRLWSLMNEDNAHLSSLESLKFLVLDEADRMIEFGHFHELRNILDRVNGAQGPGSARQTLVFSATLTVGRRTTERKRKKKSTSSQESLDNLMEYVKLKKDAHLVDLTRSKVTVETLTETKITCTTEEKDMYLYYFLLLYPGRTLVFVNSIDCLQRLRALLEVLHMKPLPLHAHMQQRQRLKNLDRFTSSETGVLVASDVAARGLDLPQVQHVIHYQVPRNTELYVHRSGRTARAQREGLSVVLVGPEDLKAYRNICRSLNKDEELPSFPVDSSYLKAIKRRVSLARQIHSSEHHRNKAVRAEQWLSKSAKAMDIEIDEDLLKQHSRKSGRRDKRTQASNEDAKIQALRAELGQLLKTAIIPRTISMTFPTRDHTHHSILANIQGSKARGMNKVIVSEKKDALTVARTKTTS